MKKTAYFLASVCLILATLACRLPFGSSANTVEETAVNDTVSDIEETTQEVVETEAVAAEAEEVSTEPVEPVGTTVYSDRGIEITLPSSYMMGDVEKDLAILVEGLTAMSEDPEDAADLQALYDKNEEDIMFWGYDTNSPPSHQTSVVVMKNEEFAGMSLALISSVANVLLGGEVDSMSKESMTLGSRDVVRFNTTSENAGVQTAQAIYIFNDSGKLWLIGFFTNLDQYEERLPSFNAAVESFTVVDVE
jgi:hypothetical protein